jgi:hypothetical protein
MTGNPWELLISSLLTINILLMGWVGRRLTVLESKESQKLDKTECEKSSARCQAGVAREVARVEAEIKKEVSDLWSAHNGHSHTTLPETAKVTR